MNIVFNLRKSKPMVPSNIIKNEKEKTIE